MAAPNPAPGFVKQPDRRLFYQSVEGGLRVRAGGKVIAESDAVLMCEEADYAPVPYFPRAAVDMSALTRTQHSSHCPFKGDASYWSLAGDGGENAVWSYETPFDEALPISGYIAFYGAKVDAIELV
jgi:uncharacterized protein (DUF427 family)